MDTFFARNRLSAYLDGTLPETEASEVASAIEHDAGLRAEYESMRDAVGLLHSIGRVPAPAGFHARVMDGVASERAPGGSLAWLRRPIARIPLEAMAVAAAALFVVWVIQGRWDRGDEPEVAKVEAPTPATDATPGMRVESDGEELAAPEDEEDAVSKEEGKPAAATAPNPPAWEPVGGGTLKKEAVVPPLDKTIVAQSAEDEPFVAEWEKEGAAKSAAPPAAAPASSQPGYFGSGEAQSSNSRELSQGIEMRSMVGYRLTLGRADALQELAKVAAGAGGRLTDATGEPIAARTLDAENNYVKVMLIVPSGQSDVVHGMLRKMGATAAPPPGAAPLLASGDSVWFQVEVQYMP